MANLIMARAIFAPSIVGSAGTGAGNLLTPDPKEVAGHSASVTYDIDFGSANAFNAFLVGFIGGTVTSVTLQTATGLGTGLANTTVLSMGPVGARRRHAVAFVGPFTSRYWRYTVAGGPFTIGIMAFGAFLQPAWGHEWGSGRIAVDRSDKTPLKGGGWGIERGARVPGWQFTAGDLNDAEVASLWDIVQEVGESAPVIVCEDPGAAQPALNEGLHYGLFDRPEAYERQAPNLNRWSFRVLGWI